MEKALTGRALGNYMFEVLDVHGNVVAIFDNRKRGTAFVIDEEKLRTASVWQPKHRSTWFIRLFFPLLVPIDSWIAKRFE